MGARRSADRSTQSGAAQPDQSLLSLGITKSDRGLSVPCASSLVFRLLQIRAEPPVSTRELKSAEMVARSRRAASPFPLSMRNKQSNILRVGICKSMLNWTYQGVQSWTTGRTFDGADLILLTIFTQSARTCEAVVKLGESGFGEQGLMLNRSLFEDIIDAHWVSLNRDLAGKRLNQHDLQSRLLRAEIQRRFPRFFESSPPKIKVTSEELEELTKLFNKTGTGSWTGVSSLNRRVELVKGCWTRDEEQETLLFWAAWVNKISNEMLHPSALHRPIRLADQVRRQSGLAFWQYSGLATAGPTRCLLDVLPVCWTHCRIVQPGAADEMAERFQAGDKAFTQANDWQAPPPSPNVQ